eukprot:TRINITY_DN10204_c0_g1_i1.p1 TRINITY_DN10204_c0_g1~~TRINITY_DN10204_c0_g1_i1.p1  ORF type:complete len:240 (-),score=21.17 TRINITY_DN10204_c0_g1_i1:15-734(-)
MGLGWWVFLVVTVGAILVHLLFFAHSIDFAFEKLIQYIYIYPQDATPLHQNFYSIYCHIYGNGVALLLGLFQFCTSPRTSPLLHRLCGFGYLFCLTIGCVGGVVYANTQPYGSDKGVAAQVSFLFMGLSSLLPAYLAALTVFIYSPTSFSSLRGPLPHDTIGNSLHYEMMLRSITCLWSSFFFFRLLARFLLPLFPAFYEGWIATIWLSWVVPLWFLELYLSWSKWKLIAHRTDSKKVK